MSNARKIWLGAGLVVVLAAVAVIVWKRRDRGVEVRLEVVARRDLVAVVTASGRIMPAHKVDVSADITGRITRLAVGEGDAVRRGAFLLEIDPTIYRANLQRARAAAASAEASAVQAEANRDQARRALTRTEELRATNTTLVSQEQLEQAQTAFEVARAVANAARYQVAQAQAALQEARDQLAKTRIVAPIGGRITRLAVEEGEVAVPGTFSRETGLLLTVSDLSVIQAVVQVDETDVVQLTLGDSVAVAIDAFPDTTFTGRVTKIRDSAILPAAGALSQSDRAVDYEVEVTLDHPPADVRPDLSATAHIVTATRDTAVTVPIIALTLREHTPIHTELEPADSTSATTQRETEGVFVVSGRTVTFRPVRVGIAGAEYFEVLRGVRPGDTIVAGPYQAIRDLKDGAVVRPQKRSADSARD